MNLSHVNKWVLLRQQRLAEQEPTTIVKRIPSLYDTFMNVSLPRFKFLEKELDE